MDNIQELETWLEENCYSFSDITIGRHRAPEGYVITADHGRFQWRYSDRGRITESISFASEKELVSHAFKQLTADQFANAHILAFTFDEAKIKELGALLEQEGIAFVRNDVPDYSAGKRAYRIFVFGRDIIKTEHLREKYMDR